MATATATDKIELWRGDIIAFARDLRVRRPDGTIGPIVLSPRQERALLAFAARKADGTPAHKTTCLLWPKRSGKSLLAAICILWISLWPGRDSYILANSREQARGVIFGQVQALIDHTPSLKRSWRVLRNEIRTSWGTTIAAIPCKVGTRAGTAVTGLLVSDELWAAQDGGATFDLMAAQTEAATSQILVTSQTSSRTSRVYKFHDDNTKRPAEHRWVDYIKPDELRGSDGRCDAAKHPNPFVTQTFLDEQLAELGGHVFDKFFLNEWGSSGLAMFKPDDVEAIFNWKAPTGKRGSNGERGESWREFARSLDVGGGLDRSHPTAEQDEAAWTYTGRRAEELDEPEPDGWRWRVMFYILRHTAFLRGTEGELIAEHLKAERAFGTFTSFLEAYETGDLVTRISGAETVWPSTQRQHEIYTLLGRVVRERRLLAGNAELDPELKKLRAQLYEFEIDTSRAIPRYGKSGTAADDRVYSLAWSVAAANVTQVATGPRAVAKAEGM